ncbi:hypothetical protein B0H13DRAFT_1898935 [Mycena leptocephala]|nr:hypothetical protein B0H13DRAFT_1898935 [Mycena leptocephala]
MALGDGMMIGSTDPRTTDIVAVRPPLARQYFRLQLRSLLPKPRLGDVTVRGRTDAPPRGYQANSGWDHRRSNELPWYCDDRPTRQRRYSMSPPRYHRRNDGVHGHDEGRRGDNRRGLGRGMQRGQPVRPQVPQRDALAQPIYEWKREIFPPDVSAAPLNSGGHLVFPDDATDVDDDYLTDEDEMQPPTLYERNEEARRNKAVHDEKTGARKYEQITDVKSLTRLGIWAAADQVQTFVQALNVVRWMRRGESTAMEFLRSTVTMLGTDPTLVRSVSEVALLQYQNQVMARYNAVVKGDKVPRSKRANPGRAGAPFRAAVVPITIGTPGALRELAMDDVPDATPVYLGTSPILRPDTTVVHLAERPPSDDLGRRGTTASRSAAVRWYTAVPTSHWPRGMRVNYTDLPATTMATPLEGDVAAWFTINALTPRRDDSTSLHRASFLGAAIKLLSVHGTFDHYAIFGSYEFASHPLEHYPFSATNISFAQVVSWFMQHGIDSKLDGLANLESFARARRNHFAGSSEINALVFDSGFPSAMHNVAKIVIRDEDLWENLRHGEVRPGIVTHYPAYPSKGAAIDEDVVLEDGAENGGISSSSCTGQYA